MGQEWETTELHIAAYNCDLDLLQDRLAAGDDVNSKDSKGFTALHWCAFRGLVGPHQHLIAKCLIENGTDPNALTEHGDSVLLMAIYSWNQLLIDLLVKEGADVNLPSNEVTPLMAAASTGKEQIVRLLLQNGADPTLKVGNFTPSDYAWHYGHDKIMEILQTPIASVSMPDGIEG